ncbi:PREDICTED: uncharacterized protein LOC104593845 isoform X2 [Nelumbo nucifera]|uniref:START domain-containing protein n=2 Tax=Nelumbo nucifera TaxID=4432 RepID=A0A822Z6X1_NELNU|nr:PREDICTED: uncharacterized protein LOC104593845 isoform X2 [Nelumbo nucifera]DAD38716.1 TPA_asm: hypothetical protein HUJ06_013038 [Nelumbo nucifera]
MGKTWFLSWNLTGIFFGSNEFWRENVHVGWATIFVLLFIFIWQLYRSLASRRFRFFSSTRTAKATVSRPGNPQIKGLQIISNEDLRNLITALDGKVDEKEKWDEVINKRNNLVSYNAKCCKPKDGPLKYLSVTIFENCSTELLRDFYMDNEYRKQWDKMLIEHMQLQIDKSNGTEIGSSIKKFPLLTPREYILAWRVWEGKDKTYYCFIKECEHVLAPLRKNYVRVRFFRSGWRIRKEMAKLAFAKGIWSYVCKMDSALRKYSTRSCVLPKSAMTAVTLIQKVPPELEAMRESSISSSSSRQVSGNVRERKLSRMPSKKLIANGLLLLGGAIFLSRSHSTIGAKLAVVCFLKKLTKHKASSSEVGQGQAMHDSLHHN